MAATARKITVAEKPTQQQVTIPRAITDKTLEDPWALRDLGLEHVRALAGKIWTDHNVHDPGRTILETLCYAISDLAYRTSYETKDLLTPKPDPDGAAAPKQFFTAREILSTCPVTDEDFRKIMIDCAGVKNAWIASADQGEVPLYIDRDNIELTTTKPVTTDKDKLIKNTIKLRGLNNIYLELERDVELGDLNDNVLHETLHLSVGSDIISLDLDIGFGGLFDPATLPNATANDFKLKKGHPYLLYQADWSPEHEDWSWADITEITDIKIHKPILWLKKDILLPLRLKVKTDNENKILGIVLHISERNRVNMQASAVYDALTKLLKNDKLIFERLFEKHQSKVKRRIEIVEKLFKRVHENRPLAEDYLNIFGTKMEEIAVCADIEIASDTDTQKIYGEIVFKIEQFLAPDIQFHSLESLLDKGMDSSDIFDGPALDHGFIDTQELKDNKSPDCIHLSDLIDIIMDIEGVVAVKSLKLASFIDNQPVAEDKKWVLKLKADTLHVPRLSLRKSSFSFFKGILPSAIDGDNPGLYYEELLARKQRNKLAVDTYDIDIPKGQYRNIESYTSLQNHFPLNYGIGKAGLSDSESESRKAKARQLKAYLMFFDQMLANYLAQLSHTKDLLGIHSSPDIAYAVQPLYSAPNVASLFTDFLKSVKSDIDLKNTEAVQQAWDDYVALDPNTGYRNNLQTLTDDPSKRDQRRNIFLDHLLARFAEQFTDYAILLNDLQGRKRADFELIKDKTNFLQNYPKISSERGKGFDYCDPQKHWKLENRSGLSQRVSALLGIEEAPDRALAPSPKNTVKFTKDAGNIWRFSLNVPASDNVDAFMIRTSPDHAGYASKNDARNGFFLFLELVAGAHHARAEKINNNKWRIRVRTPDGGYLADSKQTYPSKDAAKQAFQALHDFLEQDYFLEGMHVVEHCLLRPLDPDYALLPIIINKECKPPPPELIDPYSYHISVILPALAQRFRNQDMRRYIETTLRMECPAHITLKICWVSYESLWTFENAYKPWLREMATLQHDIEKMRPRHKKLVEALSSLRSIYPEAVLHDCENPDEDLNPVVLDYTSIGTFIEFDPDMNHED